MATGLAAAHAEQDVRWPEPAMHPDGLVCLGDALGEVGIEGDPREYRQGRPGGSIPGVAGW